MDGLPLAENIFVGGGGFLGGAAPELPPEGTGPPFFALGTPPSNGWLFVRTNVMPIFGGGAFGSTLLLDVALPCDFVREPPTKDLQPEPSPHLTHPKLSQTELTFLHTVKR